MQYSKYILLFLVTLSAYSCSRKKPIGATDNCAYTSEFVINNTHPKAIPLQALMDKYIAKGVPGMTLLVHDGSGFYVKSAGYADVENNVLMQPCHINKLGSITKMMMGALVWQMVQEGKLDIKAPMSKYIPDVASRITNGDQITVAMLLNHTSGIIDLVGNLGYNLAVINDFTKTWTADEIVDYIAKQTETHKPGSAVKYSNSNTLLIGLILDKVSGKNHADLLQEKILTPLGMKNTYYYNYASNFPSNLLAQGYLDFNNNGGSIQNISQLNPGSGNGYTGVYSTVGDLYKFMNALMVQKSLTNADNLELIMDNMTQDDKKTWQSSWGGIHREFMAYLPDSIRCYGHGGGDIGYSANLNYFPHNQTIMAATYNYGTNLPTAIGKEIENLRSELVQLMAQ
jgi:D-alanyl-D-alanine carboxypeptidase